MGFPVLQGMTGVGSKTIRYMISKGYKVRAINIIYMEGIDTDLKTVNADKIDGWNDVRALITNKGEVLMSASATSEAGWYYRLNRMNARGAGQIAFGQHLDSWRLGMHYNQSALVQCAPIRVFRDNNEDGSRAGDILTNEAGMGLNQHTTADNANGNPPDKVGRWSASCLVGQYPSTHYNVFMPICRSMGLVTFDTTIIPGDEFAAFES